jgi:small subunit ribosomal protein S3Ae
MVKAASSPKVKKKKWFTIVAPEFLKGTMIGESLADVPEKLIGKNILTTAGDILGNAKKYISVKLKINEIKTSTAHTIVKSMNVSSYYIQRKVKHDSKIGIKSDEKSKDGKSVGILVSAITVGRCFRTVETEVRNVLKKFVSEYIKKTISEAIIIDLLAGSMQNEAKKILHKIYPIRSVELEKVTID